MKIVNIEEILEQTFIAEFGIMSQMKYKVEAEEGQFATFSDPFKVLDYLAKYYPEKEYRYRWVGNDRVNTRR